MVVRRLRADEGARWREIRLRALADAPEAYSTTLSEAAARPDQDWADRARAFQEGLSSVMFVAEESHRLVGCAGAFVSDDNPLEPELVSMWVDPAVRRSGVGAALVDALAAWARARGFQALRLFAMADNAGAITLYRACGFRPTGNHMTMPAGSTGSAPEFRLALTPKDGNPGS